MSDFLLELRCEEIPARMQAGARADLEKLFRKEMDQAGVALGELTVWSTPRRLALIARGLPLATAAVSEEVKGPRVGAPPQALDGFLRKTGLTADQLTERDGVLYAISEKPGRATRDVLAEAIPAIVRAFPWPKSQRWGAQSLTSESLRWVRPLSAIVAILGDDLVECEVGGVRSGYVTRGHRFHAPGEITIGGAHDYAEKLRLAHVIVDHAERQDLIRAKAKAAAEAEGLVLVEDEGLVIENAGLTEWPVPLLGRFDPAYLDVPSEVIQLTARTNQKYFVCQDGAGQLANAFVCTANIVASDGGTEIVAGNRKVLAARLSDARFFWEQDRKVALADQARKLERITFHEKLGTVADKVERVAKLARWLVEEGIVNPPQNGEGGHAKRGGRVRASDPAAAGQPGSDHPPVPLHHPAPKAQFTLSAAAKPQAEGDGPPPRSGEDLSLAEQAALAARLCKADLVTEMVGEFPELQGLMGGYYARAEGLPDAVADAIRDHYKPVGQGDDVPTAPVTVAVAVADKLDTLISFFRIHEKPTGSKDPFALRRAALGVLRYDLDLDFFRLIEFFVGMMNAIIRERICANSESAKIVLERLWSDEDSPPNGYGEILNHTSWPDEEQRALAFDFVAPRVGECFGLLNSKQPLRNDLLEFFLDRIEAQCSLLGFRQDVFRAVRWSSDVNRIKTVIQRAVALQAFIGTEDGTNLLAGYKRAANILKKEGVETAAAISLSYTPEVAEKALIDALDAAGPKAAAAVAGEDFAGAMAALATLRAPIDGFFDDVTVNDANPDKRQFRLALLARFRDAVHAVADFSRIEG